MCVCAGLLCVCVCVCGFAVRACVGVRACVIMYIGEETESVC